MRQYPDFSYLKACCYINCILPGILFFIPYIGYYSPISQMDEMTQQYAALVEEAAAASSEMSDKVKLLSGLALQFKLEDA